MFRLEQILQQLRLIVCLKSLMCDAWSKSNLKATCDIVITKTTVKPVTLFVASDILYINNKSRTFTLFLTPASFQLDLGPTTIMEVSMVEDHLTDLPRPSRGIYAYKCRMASCISIWMGPPLSTISFNLLLLFLPLGLLTDVLAIGQNRETLSVVSGKVVHKVSTTYQKKGHMFTYRKRWVWFPEKKSMLMSLQDQTALGKDGPLLGV
jgi:hypothetical protein